MKKSLAFTVSLRLLKKTTHRDFSAPFGTLGILLVFSCKDLHIRKIRDQKLPQGYTGEAYFCDVLRLFDAFSDFFAGAASRVAVTGSRRKSSFALEGYCAKSSLVLEKSALLRTLLLLAPFWRGPWLGHVRSASSSSSCVTGF